MKNKEDILFQRLAIVSGVISLGIAVGIFVTAGTVRKSGWIFIVIFIITYITVCVLYFPIKWIYNKLKLKLIYVRHKFFFRLMVVLSSLISVIIGIIWGIISDDITNPVQAFLMTFALVTIISFILIFMTGQVIYFSIRWVRDGSKGHQFYLRLTVVLSIVSSIIGAFIAAVDVSRITTHPIVKYQTIAMFINIVRFETIAKFIDVYGVKETIAVIDVDASITTVFVAAMCCAGVWLIYLSILWIYRGLDSDDEE